MRPELFTIERVGPGQLATMAHPRGGDWLPGETSALAISGVTILVSLLTDAENAELGLSGEAEAAQAAGLAFYRLPTPDRHVPERSALLALAAGLRAQLNQGAGVVIHCRHGVGRSSTLAAAVLVLDGWTPGHAWERITVARGLPVPDTGAQREFISTLKPATLP
jgi:protein-tyrosine phosphatase